MLHLGYHNTVPGKKPMCYNCSSKEWLSMTTLGDCCEEQKDSKRYSFLKGPDYAFKNDLEAVHNVKLPEDHEIVKYFPSAKNTLIVLLPAARPPDCVHDVYFSRLTWAPDILGIGGALFFADPFCYQPHSMATGMSSWFITDTGDLLFDEMAKVITHVGASYERIIVYGSSMGG